MSEINALDTAANSMPFLHGYNIFFLFKRLFFCGQSWLEDGAMICHAMLTNFVNNRRKILNYFSVDNRRILHRMASYDSAKLRAIEGRKAMGPAEGIARLHESSPDLINWY